MELGEALFLCIQPSSALAIVFGLGLVIVWWRRRLGTVLIGLAATAYLALGLLPIGNMALQVLEQRFPVVEIGEAPDGIVILGGAHLIPYRLDELHVPLNEWGERLTAGAALAKRFPEAKLIVTDGGSPLPAARLSVMLLRSLGIPEEQLVVEDRAQSTWDNAVFSHDLVQPEPDGRYVMVTSAWHMPRAVATFRKAGWPEPIAFPVDHVADYRPAWRTWNRTVAHGLVLADLAAREWAAMAYYYAKGRIDTLLPGPRG